MNKNKIIHTVESFIPNNILKKYRELKRFFLWKQQQQIYKNNIKKLRKKKQPLNVIFIVKDTAEWKYDSVYRMMKIDSCFVPKILLCPQITNIIPSKAIEKFNNTYNYFVKLGYDVVKACENINDDSIDINSLNPDIVFYTSLWTGYISPKYNERSLSKYLKAYVNYGFSNTVGEWGYASAFHGLMWKYFAECEDIRTIALQVQTREMQNIIVTGYPIYDEYQDAKFNTSIWKVADDNLKRIIWAPHHSIEGNNGLLKLSTFLENADSMLDIARKFHEKVQFAFKPHPMLLQALYDHPKWGKEKTDKYYKEWENGKNTILTTGSYMELFKSSDAMIHDCGSFIIEYLYTKKPVLYLGNNREEQSNVVGKKAYHCHYHGTNTDDVEFFINNVILNGDDNMKYLRDDFHNNVLLPPNNCSVAENIVKEIKKSIYG